MIFLCNFKNLNQALYALSTGAKLESWYQTSPDEIKFFDVTTPEQVEQHWEHLLCKEEK